MTNPFQPLAKTHRLHEIFGLLAHAARTGRPVFLIPVPWLWAVIEL